MILNFLLIASLGGGALLLTEQDVAALKKLSSHPRALALRRAADKALREPLISVTTSRPKNTPAGPNDFYSDAPYWWPDPKNPRGAFIRRDGETNPDRFVDNDRDLNRLCDIVLSLGSAAYLFDERTYTKRTAEFLRTFFLDAKTRMLPHMEFGQAIRGRNHGRGAGLIETRPFIFLIQGMLLAERAPGWDPSVAKGMREWLAQYARWFTTSEKGLDEKDSGNNHSTWWAAQVASFAILTGDRTRQQEIWSMYRDYLLPSQFRADGSAPKEEARTRSLGYTAMNLDAFTVICRMAEVGGEPSLWAYKAKDGNSLATAIAYAAPFVVNPSDWTKPQITKFDPRRTYFVGLAGVGMKNRDWIDLQRNVGLDNDGPANFIGLLLEMEQDRH